MALLPQFAEELDGTSSTLSWICGIKSCAFILAAYFHNSLASVNKAASAHGIIPNIKILDSLIKPLASTAPGVKYIFTKTPGKAMAESIVKMASDFISITVRRRILSIRHKRKQVSSQLFDLRDQIIWRTFARRENVLLHQLFRDLHGVERRALEQLIPDDPEAQAVVERFSYLSSGGYSKQAVYLENVRVRFKMGPVSFKITSDFWIPMHSPPGSFEAIVTPM